MHRLTALMVLAALAAASTATQAADDIRTERVQFAPGATSATVATRITGYETVDYVLGARAGQYANISMATDNGANYFNIIAPGETDVAFFNGSMASGGNQYEGVLPATGDYRVRVYLMRSAARRGETANYRLEMIIGADSAAQSPPAPGTRHRDGDAASAAPGRVPRRARRGRAAELGGHGRHSEPARPAIRLWPGARDLPPGHDPLQSRLPACRRPLVVRRAGAWRRSARLRRCRLSAITQQVYFDAGRTGTEISGVLTPSSSARYVLGAANGQDLTVRVEHRGGPRLDFQIFNPDGSFLLDMIPTDKEYRGQLWQSGDHVVEVINRGGKEADYLVVFEIR